MDTDKYHRLMPSLINQLQYAALFRSSSAYYQFLSTILYPSIISLCTVCHHYTLWKPMINLLLNHFRSSVPNIRIGSIRLLIELFNSLQTDLLVILPELLPAISELMEDTIIQVEYEVQQLIKKIESISGESLAQHLK